MNFRQKLEFQEKLCILGKNMHFMQKYVLYAIIRILPKIGVLGKELFWAKVDIEGIKINI